MAQKEVAYIDEGYTIFAGASGGGTNWLPFVNLKSTEKNLKINLSYEGKVQFTTYQEAMEFAIELANHVRLSNLIGSLAYLNWVEEEWNK